MEVDVVTPFYCPSSDSNWATNVIAASRVQGMEAEGAKEAKDRI